jgi:BTB/POZ domain-containing protein KCTD9
MSPSERKDPKVTLQVGEQRFITTSMTLAESGFFSALLSGNWDDAQPDGSYFIDADPKLFEHILRYLRRRVFPIFYDKSTGHDYAMYLALLEEAKYFQIPRLEKWLGDQTYLRAVKVRYSARELGDINSIENTVGTDTELEYCPTWKTKKIYLCPRRVYVHRGNRDACGRACEKARGDDYEDEYEDVLVMMGLAVQKTTTVDQSLCVTSDSVEGAALLTSLGDSIYPFKL